MALAMARTVQVEKGHGVMYLTREPVLYTAPLAGAPDRTLRLLDSATRPETNVGDALEALVQHLHLRGADRLLLRQLMRVARRESEFIRRGSKQTGAAVSTLQGSRRFKHRQIAANGRNGRIDLLCKLLQ